MIHKLRSAIGNRVLEVFKRSEIIQEGTTHNDIIANIKLLPRSSNTDYLFGLSIRQWLPRREQSDSSIDSLTKDLLSSLDKESCIRKVGILPSKKQNSLIVGFDVDRPSLVRSVVQDITRSPGTFWQDSSLLQMPSDKLVVDFSSPNIAKPFHMGHLKSTIVGNFLCNLNEALGHRVTRLNYLGDWGTQFGLLKYGFDAQGLTTADLKDNAIDTLYNAYVWANKEAEKDSSISNIARQMFCRIEEGREEDLTTWQEFRAVTVRELRQTYTRLNVQFDQYHGESMYKSDKCEDAVDLMRSAGLVRKTDDGRLVYSEKVTPGRTETLVKSDGSHLYLTRDIAAAIHRKELFDFDRMIYVTDSSQRDHFAALFHIINKLGYSWGSSMRHCDFGRITGMSTRQGTAVFLHDIINEARDVVLDGITKSKNLQRPFIVHEQETAEIVAVNSILVFDFSRRRRSDYKFSWDAVLKDEKNLGLSLQYVHCRLVNLEKNCGVAYNPDANTDCLIDDPHTLALACHLTRFDQAMLQSFQSEEARPLISYLDDLKHLCNSMYRHHPLKGSPKDAAEAKLLLFVAARNTMAAAMRILGLRPLDRM